MYTCKDSRMILTTSTLGTQTYVRTLCVALGMDCLQLSIKEPGQGVYMQQLWNDPDDKHNGRPNIREDVVCDAWHALRAGKRRRTQDIQLTLSLHHIS